MKILKLTGLLLLFVFIFETGTQIPVPGSLIDLSPISTTWAAPNCDVDGDGFFKDSKYCRKQNDPPYDCDDSAYSETNDCSGSGGGGDLGSAISMDCSFEVDPVGNDTLKSDGLWPSYEDAVDKVDCTVDGPSVPWPIRLGVGVKGKPENSVRKVDVVLGDFNAGTYSNKNPDGTDWTTGKDLLENLYPDLFKATPQNLDRMEPIRINVRPYRDTQTRDGIHLLPWKPTPYDIGMRFSIPGTERFSISVASEHYEGNESFTGIGCETGDEANILNNAPTTDGKMQDVSVYLWPDDNTDGYPDGYTITTGTIALVNGTPVVEPGPRYAAVCSSFGPKVCGNPRAPSLCNFLGYVNVQFTLHTIVK